MVVDADQLKRGLYSARGMDESGDLRMACCGGSARIRCDNPREEIDLSVGDHWFCPPYRRHRVERTDPAPGTLWLALHWRA